MLGKKKLNKNSAEAENAAAENNAAENAVAFESTDERGSEEKLRNVLELRRTAKEVKKYTVIMRVLSLLVVLLIVIVAIAYAVSYFYDQFGSFTVRVSKYDMMNQGLTLSETPEYNKNIAVLNADIVYDMTNISGADIPANVDKVNGSHNGENYIAYTFYLINSGDDTISYEGKLNIDSVSKGIDEAIRVAVYINGEKTIYGKTKSSGAGKESDCDEEFATATKVMETFKEGFSPNSKDKYTIVIWLEGNDPDCVDDIIGGTIKLSMDFDIVEST